MSVSSNFPQDLNCYLPAVLKELPSGWVIEYYVTDPQTGRLVRKRMKMNRVVARYSRKSDARRHVMAMVSAINGKLAGGWNPFMEEEDARMYERLEDVARRFIACREKELRPNSMRSYRSFVHLLTEWCGRHCPGVFASVFGRGLAVRYLDDLMMRKNVGPTTYNNHVKMGRVLFNWMRERCYTRQNPFEEVRMKPKPRKRRVIIPPADRRRMAEYLEAEGRTGFLLVCELVYSSLIRPNEIGQLKVKHLHLEEHYILVPGEVAKNHKPRRAAVTPSIERLAERLGLMRHPAEHYLFSSDYRPAAVPAGSKRFGKDWAAMRSALRLPAEMQLYSLRDTGIFDMLKAGIDDLSVMQHADHSSLDITTVYADHHDPMLVQRIYSKAPEF